MIKEIWKVLHVYLVRGEEGATGLPEAVVLLSGCVSRDQELVINFEWPWDSIPSWKGSWPIHYYCCSFDIELLKSNIIETSNKVILP